MKAHNKKRFLVYDDNDDEYQNDGNDAWLNAVDLFSDDSEFYGDKATRARYDELAASFNPKAFFDIWKWNVQAIAAQSMDDSPKRNLKRKRELEESSADQENVKRPLLRKEESKTISLKLAEIPDTDPRPYNPYEGCRTAKQLDESLDDFLTRLPPSATTVSSGPWILIANSSSTYRPASEDIAGLRRKANDVFESFLSRKTELERQHPHKSTGSITRMLTIERQDLEKSIRNLARTHKVLNGKWMMFTPPDQIDHIWAKVSKAVLKGTLGPSAKITTIDPSQPANSTYLICIYTEDFTNTTDVKRVLRAMRNLDLIQDRPGHPSDRTIYYKPEAYSILEINNRNQFKIKASLYNSREMFDDMKKEGTYFL